jgi:glucan phosphoethanolaminetransferase (alkaline phosphatase superfamily)
MMDAMDAPDGTTSSGDVIITTDVVGTGIFVLSAVLAAAIFTDPVKAVAVVVSLALFACGMFTFLWSYWTAVQRSRTDNISVTQLYLLAGPSTPKAVKWRMNGALTVQIAVALATAIARSSTEGRAGSTLAFGILVPMYGLGLNGLWCARYGRFGPRQVADQSDAVPDAGSVPPSADEMEQNSTHG